MAYIVDYSITESAAGGAVSVAANVPTHQADDYLIMFASVNGTAGGTSGSTNSGITVSGWTQIGTLQIANAGIASAVYYVKATTSSTTCTVAITTADDYTIKVVSVRDADLTTFLDGTPVSSNTGTTASSSWTSSTFSTTQSDSLVIYYHALDGVTPMAHSNAGTMFLVSSDSTGTTAQTSAGSAIAWYVQRTAGTVPAASWTCNISTQRTDHCFAIRNKSGGRVPAYIDDSETQATLIHPGFHIGTLNNTVVTTTMTATASINGKTMGTSTATLGADFGVNPYSSALGNTAAIVASTALNGYQITLTGNRNWSTGLIVGAFIARTPKEARYGIGSAANGGLVVRMGSSATAWNSYQVAAKDAIQTLETRSPFAIQAGYTGTTYGATQGTAVTTSAMSFIQFYYNAPLFASIAYLTDLYQVFKTTVAGGTDAAPVDIDGLTQVGNSYRLPLITKTGSAVLSYTPIQIGGGDAVNFQVDQGTIQFPRRYTASIKDLSYHAADNALGISLAGKSGDVIKLTNSVITSPTPYYFQIHASATSAATWDLTGTTIVGANITLRNIISYSKMVFSSFKSMDISGCSISNSTFSDPPATDVSITTTSTTVLNNCTFDTLTIAAGNSLLSTADFSSVLTNCTFTGSATSGHAIKCTAAGGSSLSINNLNFSGYGANTTTSAAIYFTATTGTITVNVNSGGSGLTYRSAGATINIVNSKTFAVNNIVLDSEIRIYRASDLVELAGAENVNITGTPAQGLNNVTITADADNAGRYVVTYSYNYSVDTPIIIVVMNNQYQALRNTATLKSTNQAVPVNQIFDRQYLNP